MQFIKLLVGGSILFAVASASTNCGNTGTCPEDAASLMQVKHAVKHGRENVSQASGPVELYVMRHAEGCHNMKGDWLGLSHSHKGLWGTGDPPLTAHGMLQAMQARDFFNTLSRLDIQYGLVSPMRRAQQTAILALQSTPLEALSRRMRVVPFANENSGFVTTVENVPVSPDMQECLLEQEQDSYGSPDDDILILQCNDYKNFVPGPDLETCNCASKAENPLTCTKKVYSADARASEPQKFADWVVTQYPNRKVLLATHSNWASDAGLKQEDGEKINWASVYKVTLRPGQDIKEAMAGAIQMYGGTPKSDSEIGATKGSVNKDAGCMKDLEEQKQCSDR